MKLTAVTLSTAMIISVLCAYYLSFNSCVILAAVLFIICIVFSFIRKRVQYIVITLGFIAAGLSFFYSASNHPTSEFYERYVTLNAVVISNPEKSYTSDNYKYTVKAYTRENNGKTDSFKDTILISTPQKLRCGDSISFGGIIKPLPEKSNENGFNTALYYKSQNIYSKIYTDKIAVTGSRFVFSPFFISQKFYQRIDDMIYKRLDGDNAAVLSAILTGNNHHFSKELNAVMKRTAFTRMLHPAFLHILIITMLIGFLTPITNKKLRTALMICIIGIYAVLSSTNIGFIRCLITTALMLFYREKDGAVHYPDILAKLCIVCILSMPMIIFNVKFILSMSAGLLIWAFMPELAKRLYFLPERIKHTTIVMLICALFLTPLSAIFYNGICIYAFILPFIMTPLVLAEFMLTVPVFTMLALFGKAPILGGYFIVILKTILKLPYIVDGLPFSHILTPTPTPAEYMLTVILIIMCYMYLKHKRNIFYAAAALGLMTSIITGSLLKLGTTEFTFVNVGQGDGSVIHTFGGGTAIIDGGGTSGFSDYNAGEYQFVPYLISKGYNNIDIAFVSHFHSDHIDGIISAIENLTVKNVYYMPPQQSDDEALENFERLKAAAELNGTKLCTLNSDTRIQFDKGAVFDIYLPAVTAETVGNDSSLLIKADYNGCSILYTGDMSKNSEYSFLKRAVNPKALVLKAGHHGSKSSNSEEWVNTVSPTFAVISCGENNSYGHPSKETLKAFQKIRVLRTDTDGDIKITADRNGFKRINKFK